jgi:Acetyltransferase (GNAT) domain
MEWRIMKLALFDDASIHQLVYPMHLKNEAQYLIPIVKKKAAHFADNIHTDFRIIQTESKLIPISVNEKEYDDAWVCSIFSAFINCGKNSLNAKGISLYLWEKSYDLFGLLLKGAQCNRTVQVNNWLLSSNIYVDWDENLLHELTSFLIKRFPHHAIVFRSLNHLCSSPSIAWFKSLGYSILPTMQTHVFNGQTEKLSSNQHHNDRRIAKKSLYRVAVNEPLSSHDYDRMAEIYRMLYISKHSPYNPIFKPNFFRLFFESGLVTILTVRQENGALVGAAGLLTRGSIAMVPFAGYDTSLDRKLGIYRILTHAILKTVYEKRLIFNWGSGVSEFKTNRRARPILDFGAVFFEHLPQSRQLFWKAATRIVNSAASNIIEHFDS